MSIKRILAIVLAIILFCFYLCNLSTANSIDDLAYVIGLGFDVSENNKLKLSFQFAKPESYSSEGSSSTSESKGEDESTIITTIECNSINEGIKKINTYIEKRINLSYCKIAVFSENVAEQGIMDYVSTLMNNIEIRPYCDILVSKCEAKYFLENSAPLLKKLSAKYYESAEFSEKDTGFTRIVTLLDFYNSYYDSNTDSIAMLGDVVPYIDKDTTNNDDKAEENDNENSEDSEKKNEAENIAKEIKKENSKDKKVLNISGLAVFNDGKFRGELNEIETLCNLIVSNRLKSSEITIPSPFDENEFISLYISKAKSENTVHIIDGRPFIQCNVKISARILSNTTSSNYMSKENKKKIEEAASNYFTEQIANYINKTIMELKSDVSGFGNYAIRNTKKFKNEKAWKDFNWGEKYQSAVFEVRTSVNLKSSYLIIGIN